MKPQERANPWEPMTLEELRTFTLALFNAAGEISPLEAGKAFTRAFDATMNFEGPLQQTEDGRWWRLIPVKQND